MLYVIQVSLRYPLVSLHYPMICTYFVCNTGRSTLSHDIYLCCMLYRSVYVIPWSVYIIPGYVSMLYVIEVALLSPLISLHNPRIWIYVVCNTGQSTLSLGQSTLSQDMYLCCMLYRSVYVIPWSVYIIPGYKPMLYVIQVSLRCPRICTYVVCYTGQSTLSQRYMSWDNVDWPGDYVDWPVLRTT